MRKRAFCLRSITIAIMAAGVFLALSDCRAQSQHELNAGETDSLERFLRNYLKNEYVGNDLTTRYSAALVKLTNGNEPDVIVYITGRTWCGSGGCKMLVLVPERASYEVVTETTVTRLPIRLLATMSHGWHDIGVWVQGGGIQSGYEADLPFDGKTYPRNPTTAPARRVEEKMAGEVVLPGTAVGKLLY